jgi:hypothetical protein
MHPGVVDQDPTHHLRGHREEVIPVLPPRALLRNQPDVRLMDERRRLQRVSAAFSSEICTRATM